MHKTARNKHAGKALWHSSHQWFIMHNMQSTSDKPKTEIRTPWKL